MKRVLLLLSALASLKAGAQWVTQETGVKVQFRGLSAVSDKVCWAAGSEGTFARTVDGTHWQARKVAGAEQLMFRSVVAWSANSATLLAIGAGEASRIYHTEDGGAIWQLQFINRDANAFYDCVQFWDRRHGIALSDPVDGRFRILRTDDSGRTWKVVANRGMPLALPGEGAFAASGTCLVVKGSRDAWFATGGAKVSRVFHSADRGLHWTVAQTPVPAAKPSKGIFGLAFLDRRRGIAVGGDYKAPQADGSAAVTIDGGKTWSMPKSNVETAINGWLMGRTHCLLECACFFKSGHLVATGPDATLAARIDDRLWNPSRIDLGEQTRLTWEYEGPLSDGVANMHACAFAGTTGWEAGDNGIIKKNSRLRASLGPD